MRVYINGPFTLDCKCDLDIWDKDVSLACNMLSSFAQWLSRI